MTEMSLQGSILGVGNPLLDLSSEVPLSLLEQYSIQLNNAILAEESHLSLYSELFNNYKVDFIAGGSTLNTIRVLQWMGQTPGLTSYMGAIGEDNYGEILERCSTEDGVLGYYMKNKEV